MNSARPIPVSPAAVARIARSYPSFRDFVDDALFHPQWGYYSTGQVRFGVGGHYDTFPISLSPLFGRMVARYGYRLWRRYGEPRVFEICELGAGNGQLCMDVITSVNEEARRARESGPWRHFEHALRYRIIERSRALIARQRQHLGPLALHVTWTRADLARRAARGTPFANHGLVFANEVLDCLAHHKIVPLDDGRPGVVFVMPLLHRHSPPGRSLRLVAGLRRSQWAVPRRRLAKVLSNARLRPLITFREMVLPVEVVPGLSRFLRRHCPEFFHVRTFQPYFACPDIEPLLRHTARLYRSAEQLWIDYGHTRAFHLKTPTEHRVFAGPPRSDASVYRDPGGDDITFMVDFSVVGKAAERTGMVVGFYGEQGELARRSRVKLDRRTCELILRHRALDWMLALVGIGPERTWRRTALTWDRRAGRGGSMRHDVRRGIDEFVGKRTTSFKLMILLHGGDGR
jgi:SAM-dependent MidA family methyltransferase